jgi:FHS family L-fucose permease-like MFS transporter
MNRRTIPIFLAFLCMGFLDFFTGSFVGLAQKEFGLSLFVAQLIPFVGLIMFGVLSIPVGLLQDRTGKKSILVLGLGIALAGMVIPLFGLTPYLLFLAVFLLGAGVAVMQVAGNPIVRDVSAAEKYSRNLSLGQFIKAIGSVSGSLIVPVAVSWWNKDWRVLIPVYAVTLLGTVILLGATKIEEQRDESRKPATFLSCLALLSNRYILAMVAGIFVYVGAEVCISNQVPIYLNKRFDIKLETWSVLGNAFFFFWLLTGRFLGAVVLNWISAKKFLVLTVLVAIVGLLGLLLAPDWKVAIVGITLAGLGCANVFPLIFSITIDSMPQRSNEISGLMVTAIVGGAFLPPLMGLLVDRTSVTLGEPTSVTLGFLVPLACCLYLVYVALFSLKVRPIPDET